MRTFMVPSATCEVPGCTLTIASLVVRSITLKVSLVGLLSPYTRSISITGELQVVMVTVNTAWMSCRPWQTIVKLVCSIGSVATPETEQAFALKIRPAGSVPTSEQL